MQFLSGPLRQGAVNVLDCADVQLHALALDAPRVAWRACGILWMHFCLSTGGQRQTFVSLLFWLLVTWAFFEVQGSQIRHSAPLVAINLTVAEWYKAVLWHRVRFALGVPRCLSLSSMRVPGRSGGL